MKTKQRIRSALASRNARHSLPRCATTGLARYRDRKQARDGLRSACSGEKTFTVSSFKCHACHGFHLERFQKPGTTERIPVAPALAHIDTTPDRKRRYMLIDIENMFGGRIRTPEEVSRFWKIITQQAPGITDTDHVVIGAGRGVARHYRHLISGGNVKWVIGANAANGADRALLASIDVYQVAKKFDEVVIMSGDHAFTPIALQARKHGLSVQLVTVESTNPRGNRAYSLMKAAHIRTVIRLTSRTSRNRNLAKVRQLAVASDVRDTSARGLIYHDQASLHLERR